MRRSAIIVLIVCCLALLVSCASVPNPENDRSSLVIGSIALDFPDGLFDLPPRVVSSGIILTVRNTTQGHSFDLRVNNDGYFYFLSNGSDAYSLLGYRYTFTTSGRSEYSISQGLGASSFHATPGQICYLGHIVHRYTSPKKTDLNLYARKGSSWNYQIEVIRDNKSDEMLKNLKAQNDDMPWLQRMVTLVVFTSE
jgi:hypothetical protein